jgi:hypothetical protein
MLRDERQTGELLKDLLRIDSAQRNTSGEDQHKDSPMVDLMI